MKKVFLVFGLFFLFLLKMSSDSIGQTDQEGNEFRTIKIGKQIWMAENLNVEHYRNGDLIPQVKDKNEWLKLKTGAWCFYENDPSNCKKFGRLYNWYAVNDPRGLAPEGWHIPTQPEFEILWMPLFYNAGVLMKEGSGKKNGFSAIFAGGRLHLGANPFFSDIGRSAHFWTATEDKNSSDLYGYECVYAVGLDNDSNMPMNFSGSKISGFSVRCVKDEGTPKKTQKIINKKISIKEIITNKGKFPIIELEDNAKADELNSYVIEKVFGKSCNISDTKSLIEEEFSSISYVIKSKSTSKLLINIYACVMGAREHCGGYDFAFNLSTGSKSITLEPFK